MYPGVFSLFSGSLTVGQAVTLVSVSCGTFSRRGRVMTFSCHKGAMNTLEWRSWESLLVFANPAFLVFYNTVHTYQLFLFIFPQLSIKIWYASPYIDSGTLEARFERHKTWSLFFMVRNRVEKWAFNSYSPPQLRNIPFSFTNVRWCLLMECHFSARLQLHPVDAIQMKSIEDRTDQYSGWISSVNLLELSFIDVALYLRIEKSTSTESNYLFSEFLINWCI